MDARRSSLRLSDYRRVDPLISYLDYINQCQARTTWRSFLTIACPDYIEMLIILVFPATQLNYSMHRWLALRLGDFDFPNRSLATAGRLSCSRVRKAHVMSGSFYSAGTSVILSRERGDDLNNARKCEVASQSVIRSGSELIKGRLAFLFVSCHRHRDWGINWCWFGYCSVAYCS